MVPEELDVHGLVAAHCRNYRRFEAVHEAQAGGSRADDRRVIAEWPAHEAAAFDSGKLAGRSAAGLDVSRRIGRGYLAVTLRAPAPEVASVLSTCGLNRQLHAHPRAEAAISEMRSA